MWLITVRFYGINTRHWVSWLAYAVQWIRQRQQPTFVHCSFSFAAPDGQEWDFHYSVEGLVCYPGHITMHEATCVSANLQWTAGECLEYIKTKDKMDRGMDWDDVWKYVTNSRHSRNCIGFVLCALGYDLSEPDLPDTCDRLNLFLNAKR